MSALQLSIVALQAIIVMADEKEDYYSSDTDGDDSDLHVKFFTALDENTLGCKDMDVDFVIHLTARARLMIEDDDLTEDALRRLAPGKE